jgi:O-antigen ligase
MLELRRRNGLSAGTIGIDSFIKEGLGLVLFILCLGGDILLNFFFENSIIFFTYFTLFCFFFILLLIKEKDIRLSYAVIPLGIFIGINCLSLFWSVRPKDAEIAIVLLFTGFITFFIFSNMIKAEDDIYFFFKYIVMGTSLNALIGICQGILGYNSFPSIGFAALGTTCNPNVFSGFLGMVYPVALLIFIKERKNVWLLAIFLILLANFFSLSRVGIFTSLLISAVSVLFLCKKGYRHTGIKILFVVLLAALAYFFSLALRAKLYPDVSSEVTLRRDLIPTAILNRFRIWQGTLPIIFQHLFAGAGLRSFQDMFKHFNNPFVVWPRPHAHNLFLQITSEVGILGLFFFVLFICSVGFFCIKHYAQSDNSQFKISSFFLLVGLSSFFFNNLTEYNWEYPLFQVLFYFLASIAYATRGFSNPGRKELSFHVTIPYKAIISGLSVAFWIFYVGRPCIASYYVSQAKKNEFKNNEKVIHYLLKASFLDPHDPEPYSVLFQIYKKAWFDTKKETFFEKAVQSQEMVIHSIPMEADFYLDMAKLYEDAKKTEEAQRYFKKAIEINPNMPQYKNEFALFLARNNNTEEAIALWENLSVFLERYDPRGISLMTVYMNLCAEYKKMGRLELLKNYLDLVKYFPDDMLREEPVNPTLRENFISYKKKASDELANLTRRKNFYQ